jgi:hypothetical protein
LIKYSNDGELLMGIFPNSGEPYIELICIDNGPGMLNASKMIQDGISTTNTLGHGLGSIKRLSDDFEIYSQIGWGTIVLSRVYNNPHKTKPTDIIIRPIVVFKPGEKTSGDGYVYKKNDNYFKIMLADGLGHGPEANKAVNEAAIAFKVFPDYSPAETIRFIHNSIKKTRGVVINILSYNFASKTWDSAGVGNIATRFFGPMNLKNVMSYNGIVGHNIPNTLNNQTYSSGEFNYVMMCSDGINTRIELAKYPNILKYDLTILAAAIYKDHSRRNDDMSIVIVKVK